MNALAQVDAPRLPAMQSGGTIRPIVPQSMEDAYRLAKAVCVAGMAPKGLDTPEKAMIAIMQGMEVGMTPMASLQRIAVVSGRPTIWGDGAMSLVRGSGLCEYVRETIDGKDDARVAVCTVKRRGEREEVSRRFSVSDAKKASLWGKQGPWQQYPERMLQMRARAFALRDVFADVLGGMYLREEIEDARAEPARDVTPPSPPSPPAVPTVPQLTQPSGIGPETGESTDAIRDIEPLVIDAFIGELVEAMATGKDADQVIEIWDGFDVEATLSENEEALQRAFDLRADRLVRFSSLNGG